MATGEHGVPGANAAKTVTKVNSTGTGSAFISQPLAPSQRFHARADIRHILKTATLANPVHVSFLDIYKCFVWLFSEHMNITKLDLLSVIINVAINTTI